MGISIDKYGFDLLKNESDWEEWRKGIYDCPIPCKYPCLADVFSNGCEHESVIYLYLDELEAAVTLLKKF